MTRMDLTALKNAFEQQHGCNANYMSTVHIRESFDETVV